MAVNAMGNLAPIEGEQRASDSERDEVAARLAEALAVGQLSPVEHTERLEAAYAAKTRGELAPLVADLPESPVTAVAATGRDQQRIDALGSKVVRRGKVWLGRRTTLRPRFGGLIVDLRDAVFPGREVTLDVAAFCGKLYVLVPRNSYVIDEGEALFSKRSVSGGAPAGGEVQGPVIRITGRAVFSKVLIQRGREDFHFDLAFGLASPWDWKRWFGQPES